MRYFPIFFLIILSFFYRAIQAQENEATTAFSDEPVGEIFRTMRIINMHSVATLYKNDFFMTISHKFGGTIADGIDDFFGMDQLGNIRLGVAYGLTDDLTVGLGRTRLGKVYDGFAKYRVLQQRTQSVPLTITVLGSAAIRSEEWRSEAEKEELEFKHRMSYLLQGSLARKFDSFLSLQLTASLVHRNLTDETTEENTVFALGGAGRFRITDDFVLLFEYNTLLTEYELVNRDIFDGIGFGFDITSARHSYKFHVSNVTTFIGQEFLTDTRSDFFEDGLHFGFHITRYFGL